MANLVIHTDGGSRGNPGLAGIGVLVLKDGRVVFEIAKAIGVATNNEAEYKAVLEALNWLKENTTPHTGAEVQFLLDSKLVVEQLSRNWKIKEPRLAELAKESWQKIAALPHKVVFKHIPRAENVGADALVNQALDVMATKRGG